jgi:tetratricopeptide (TPR) repeat protein
MKKHFWIGVAWIAMLSGSPAFAQFGSVKGVCKDAQGKPIAGARVEMHAVDSARTYKFKTDSQGEFSSIAVMPGRYNAVLLKDEQEIDSVNGLDVGLSATRLDFDLQHRDSSPKNLTPEQMKQLQEQQAKQQYAAAVVKVLNEKLATANQSIQTGDYDGAIATLTEATKVNANVDLLWARMGAAYLASAPKQTDADEKTKRFGEAADSYQKAIDVKQKQLLPGKQTPQQAGDIAGYKNNLAHADAKLGKIDEAVKELTEAAQLDPPGASQYYYNLGAILINAGKTDDAIAAFDKSINADPTKAAAYYQRGVALIGKAVPDKDGKIIAAPGTAEAFNKYLELEPHGEFAEGAKSMIQYLGGTIDYGHTKAKKQ